jgi:hypothetical protein
MLLAKFRDVLATIGYMGTILETPIIETENTVAMSAKTIIVVWRFSPGSPIASWTFLFVLDRMYRKKKVIAADIPMTDVLMLAKMAILDRYDSMMGKMTTRRMMLMVKSRVTRVSNVGNIVEIHRAVPLRT